jgi:hypothetical protein
MGDEIKVKVLNVDGDGKVRLSHKETLEKPEGYVEPEPREGGGGGGDRGRRGPSRRTGGGGGGGGNRGGGDRGRRRR